MKLITRRGEMITYLDIRGRNKCPQGLIYTTFFDAGQLANKLTLDATDQFQAKPTSKNVRLKWKKRRIFLSFLVAPLFQEKGI